MYLRVQRNLARDLRDVIEQEIERAGDTYVASAVAYRIVERLRAEDPELLNKYLDEHAVQIVRAALVQLESSQRTRARQLTENPKKTPLADALERNATGRPEMLASWLDTTYVVTTAHQRKHLRDMYREDLEYAEDDYRDRAANNTLKANFLGALKSKVGAKTVGEVFTDEELARLWNSLE